MKIDYSKSVHTVEELINLLKKYPKDTELCHLTGNRNTSKTQTNLFICETHPAGSRDMEDVLMLAFSSD